MEFQYPIFFQNFYLYVYNPLYNQQVFNLIFLIDKLNKQYRNNFGLGYK